LLIAQALSDPDQYLARYTHTIGHPAAGSRCHGVYITPACSTACSTPPPSATIYIPMCRGLLPVPISTASPSSGSPSISSHPYPSRPAIDRTTLAASVTSTSSGTTSRPYCSRCIMQNVCQQSDSPRTHGLPIYLAAQCTIRPQTAGAAQVDGSGTPPARGG